jgi:hypothetical protein
MSTNTVTRPAANTVRRALRLRYALLSGLGGWLLSQVACLPFNLVIAVRDTEGQMPLLLKTLAVGLLAWAAWTFWLALIGWGVVVLPLVITLRPCLLVRRRPWFLPGAAVLAAAVVGSYWHAFMNMGAVTHFGQLSAMLPYVCFGVAYAVGTAALYIAMSKQKMGSAVR